MELVHSRPSSATSRPTLQATRVRLRLRPGERPSWTDASPWEAAWEDWRQAARASGVALDAAVSCLLEYDMACCELGRWLANPASLVGQVARAELSSPRLADDPELRQWLRGLGQDRGSGDELPEIALPQRLLGHPVLRARWGERVDASQLECALRCERAASLSGNTLEGWALRVGLASLAAAV